MPRDNGDPYNPTSAAYSGEAMEAAETREEADMERLKLALKDIVTAYDSNRPLSLDVAIGHARVVLLELEGSAP